MNQETTVEPFSEGYLRALEARVARSELVGTILLKGRSVALFYDRSSSKFTMLEKTGKEDVVSVFDAIQREQWGRQVMVFGHETNTGGYIASGHGTLTGDQFAIRLANGRYYRLTVDPTLPHLAPYFVERVETARPEGPPMAKTPPKERGNRKGQPAEGKGGNRPPRSEGNHPARDEQKCGQNASENSFVEEHEDFDDDDLARLRGEMPMVSRKAKGKRKY